MSIIKNRAVRVWVAACAPGALGAARRAGLLLALALLAGCTPPGPRALLEGKRLLEQGQYPQAIQKLRKATELLGGTNAVAWGYLGLAYQHDGRAAEAEWAYLRALEHNRDLSEVRFNLGCLRLEQNKLEAAKADLTACTLASPNAPQAFLKLGSAQLRSREPSAAEKSFSEALQLNPNSPEAWNGLGLARLQRGRVAEAAQCFESALKQQPDYPPALLNLAIVAHQYLRDRQLALQRYREYLAIEPTPANAEALAPTVRQLEQELTPPVRRAPTNALAQLNAKSALPRPPATNLTRAASAPKAGSAAVPPRPVATNVPKPAPVVATATPAVPQAAKAPAEPVSKRTPDLPQAPAQSQVPPTEPLVTTSSVPAGVAAPKPAKRGFFERMNPLNLFRSTEKTPARTTPLGSPGGRPPQPEPASPGATAAEPTDTSPSARPSKGPPGRYAYRLPTAPVPGNRPEAERSFAQGVQAQQAHRLPEAIQAYRTATRQDPSLFEAHYNLGLVAAEAGNLPLALASYESALAIQPRSLDARYNFALALKEANCPNDAVREFQKVLAYYPNEARAHLALGNLYAQQLAQPAKARQHYRKLLEVDPQHPQADAIRYWLTANPP